ncbi:MAG: hypothetical protein RMK29_18410 [Myxococcales bacterium]|nr:hypothetical protein [Myxococcota bacterium]MDW8283682.1 hypothetical protein [Myxococcales bacterium]
MDHVVWGLLGVLLVLVYPAVCLGRIAARQGRRPWPYALLSLVPPLSLVLLGVLAFARLPRPGRSAAIGSG